MYNLNIHKHPFSDVGAIKARIPQGKTLDAWLRENNPKYVPGENQPVLARVNGKPFEPAAWSSYQVKASDCITLAPRPFGVEVVVAALFVAVAYAYSQMDMPPASMNNYRDLPEQSPTYDVNAQGNTARLGQPVPVGYGRQRVYPDFASLPFRRYIDGEQYLYVTLAVGQGEYDLSDAQIGNTPIENFEGVAQQIVPPGQPVTLFSPDVYTSPEVSNIELFAPNDPEYQSWSGPIAVVPAETEVTRIELDLLAPNGLYLQDKQTGDLSTVSVTVTADYREIDDLGNAVGSWASLGSWTLSGATVDPVRKTVGKNVSPGRYEVRTRRSSNSSDPDNIRLQDQVLWGDLKGVLQSDRTYDHTVWAVKVKASNQLSAQSERKFSVVRQRKLPIWTGTEWTVPQATRNPAWAFCDAIKAGYGGNYTDDNLDLAEIKRLADVWDSRGDHFDYQFDTARTLWPALQMICMVGRAEPTIYGGVFSIVRDEPKALPDYQFGMADIVANSFSIQYATQDQWGDDSVEIEYTNPDTGAPETVLCVLPGSAGERPVKVKLEGCTDRSQAYREGMFRVGVMVWRNRTVQFKTELDGGLPGYGNCIAVSNELPEWGVSGHVLAVETVGADQVLTLSEPVEFAEGQAHAIMVRNSDTAKPQGPFTCVVGDTQHHVKIVGGTNASIYTGWRKNKSSFAFGVADTYAQRFIMRGARHTGGLEFSLSGVLDDPRVHELDAQIADGSISIPQGTTGDSRALTSVKGLRVKYGGSVANPSIRLTWSAVEGAENYILHITRDDGITWLPLGDTSSLTLSKSVDPGQARVRVASRNGNEIGPFSTLDIVPGIQSLPVPPAPTGLVVAARTATVDLSWDDPDDKYLNHGYTEVWRSESDDVAAGGIIHSELGTQFTDSVEPGSVYYYWIRFLSKAGVPGPYNAVAGVRAETGTDPASLLDVLQGQINRTTLHADLTGELDATNLWLSALDTDLDAVEQQMTQLSTTVDGNTTTIQQQAQSIAGVAASYTVKINANGHVAGYGLASEPNEAGGNTSDFVVLADRFSVLHPSASSKLVFTVSGGKTVMSAAYIKDATVTTLKLGNQAVTIPVGSFTATASTISTSWTTVRAVTITSTGAPIEVKASLQNKSWGARTACDQVRILRGGSVIATYDLAISTEIADEGGSSVSWMNFAALIRNTPGAGTHTYYLQVRRLGSFAGLSVKNRYLGLLETKK